MLTGETFVCCMPVLPLVAHLAWIKNISLLSYIIQLADTFRVGNVTVSTISIFNVQVQNSLAYANIAYLSDLHQQSEVQKSIPCPTLMKNWQI